ncbi:hypothetical protein OUZ56_026590 [Daphnia magna]|uniref:Uncharacterized protein n=1 Tax=Daphnia magna TaxID=35525 RepID=A0ABQ9ZM81_9CRUS|nr:hypothetical protein OUZ56_026585 [Daphnia magna]KAK4014044.1 hypothetical protein OUZ56_026590 [Daphnia magna]
MQNPVPQVTDAHHQEPSPTNFPSLGTLLGESFGNLQFSPSEFEGFEAILNLPSEPSAGERDIEEEVVAIPVHRAVEPTDVRGY